MYNILVRLRKTSPGALAQILKGAVTMTEKNFLFKDRELGEYFYVYTATKEKAIQTAKRIFPDPKYLGVDDDFTAEMSGYDTY